MIINVWMWKYDYLLQTPCVNRTVSGEYNWVFISYFITCILWNLEYYLTSPDMFPINCLHKLSRFVGQYYDHALYVGQNSPIPPESLYPSFGSLIFYCTLYSLNFRFSIIQRFSVNILKNNTYTKNILNKSFKTG